MVFKDAVFTRGTPKSAASERWSSNGDEKSGGPCSKRGSLRRGFHCTTQQYQPCPLAAGGRPHSSRAVNHPNPDPDLEHLTVHSSKVRFDKTASSSRGFAFSVMSGRNVFPQS